MVKEANRCDAKGDGSQNSYVTVSSLFSDISTETNPIAVLGYTRRTSGQTRRSTRGGWTNEEDECLTKIVKLCNGKNWKKIAEYLPGRSDVQCLHRWQKVLDPQLVKGHWTNEEDDLIIELVKKNGSTKWSVIAKSLKGRTCKQCRERWHNHLNPTLKKGPWTTEEEAILITAHKKYGNKWAEIAKFLPGRADNSIKNHWNWSLKKRLDAIFASGLPGHLHGIATVDLKNYVNPTKECTTFAMDSVQSKSPERLNLELQLIPPGDSLGVEKQPSSIEDSIYIRGEEDPFRRADSKCTTSEIHHHKPFIKETLESPRRSKKDGSSPSCLVVGDMTQNSAETTSSSLPACDPSGIDRVEDNNHVPTTPSCCANGNYGPLFNTSLQLIDKEGSISSKSLLTSEGNCSSSPDLSLITLLRSLAKSFPAPSIIRKRRHVSSTPETSDAKDYAGFSNLSSKPRSLKRVFEPTYERKYGKDDRADLNGTGDLRDGRFLCYSHDYLMHADPVTTKSVARRLVDDFNM